MGGNEILLNLGNADNLMNSEIVNGLIELGKRDKRNEFDFTKNPLAMEAITLLQKRVGLLSTKHVLQSALIADRLNLTDKDHWQQLAHNVLRMLHKLTPRDLAFCLHVFDKDMVDREGEPISFKKCPDEFFERIVAILPIHVKKLRKEDLVNTIEVLVKRNLGSERLFYDFLFFQVEKKMLSFSVNQFTRLIVVLADK